jgi:hypothetical protein
LSDKEKALLQKLNALKTPRWRPFGPCQYDWSAWRLLPDDVRITSVQCGVAIAAGKEKTCLGYLRRPLTRFLQSPQEHIQL